MTTFWPWTATTVPVTAPGGTTTATGASGIGSTITGGTAVGSTLSTISCSFGALMVPACGARRFEWAALLVPKRLPLLVDGTRAQTVSSAEVFWLAPDTGDVPRVAMI